MTVGIASTELDALDQKITDVATEVAQATVREALDYLAAAYLPRLRDPSSITWETRSSDGIMRKTNTPQEAILANGRGRRMRVVLEWEGGTL